MGHHRPGPSIQDQFLNALRKEKMLVSLYLVNGIKLQGQIESFDQFVVLLRNTVTQMVFKHAISTVVPAKNIRYHGPQGGAPSASGAPGAALHGQPSGPHSSALHHGLPLDDDLDADSDLDEE